jgi:hypothetical protein
MPGAVRFDTNAPPASMPLAAEHTGVRVCGQFGRSGVEARGADMAQIIPLGFPCLFVLSSDHESIHVLGEESAACLVTGNRTPQLFSRGLL